MYVTTQFVTVPNGTVVVVVEVGLNVVVVLVLSVSIGDVLTDNVVFGCLKGWGNVVVGMLTGEGVENFVSVCFTTGMLKFGTYPVVSLVPDGRNCVAKSDVEAELATVTPTARHKAPKLITGKLRIRIRMFFFLRP